MSRDGPQFLRGVRFYEDDRGSYPVVDFVDRLPVKPQVRFYEKLELLQQLPFPLPQEHVKHVEGPLLELKFSANRCSYRILLFIDSQQYAVLLHIFVKAQNRLPKREIDVARNRMARYMAGQASLTQRRMGQTEG